MKLCLTFIICVGLSLIDSVTITKEKDESEKTSESDIRVDEVIQELQYVCSVGESQQTIKEQISDIQAILNNIAIYKEFVKMKQQLRSEIKWIIDESKGPDEVSRIMLPIKYDERDVCLPKPVDCKDLRRPNHKSGVYTVYPDIPKTTSIEVYCDMETDGGGWTVFQRRIDGKTDFQRDWQSYKNGFGNPNKEFWLGNDKISKLTNYRQYELRVDLENFSGATKYAKYSKFLVGDESTNYKLTVSGYSGTAGDSLTNHNGQHFTTKDRDNDKWSKNCASGSGSGGWWYNACAVSALNRNYSIHIPYRVYWNDWKHNQYNIKATSMMFRRLN